MSRSGFCAMAPAPTSNRAPKTAARIRVLTMGAIVHGPSGQRKSLDHKDNEPFNYLLHRGLAMHLHLLGLHAFMPRLGQPPSEVQVAPGQCGGGTQHAGPEADGARAHRPR